MNRTFEFVSLTSGYCNPLGEAEHLLPSSAISNNDVNFSFEANDIVLFSLKLIVRIIIC